jgi:hypothetical protein
MTARRGGLAGAAFSLSLARTGTCLMLRAFILVALLALAGPARADDPIFPPGSRSGLVPPQGFVASKAFPGFEDREKGGLILMTELPAAAFPELEQKIAGEQLQRQGVTIESREPMTLSTGPAVLMIGHQEAGGRPFRRWILFGSTPNFTAVVSVQLPDDVKDANTDNVMRAALATFAVRSVAPVEEQLGSLPFTIGDLAGFHVAKVLGATAALLTDGDTVDLAEHPVVLVAAERGSVPADAGDRDRFARGLLSETPGVKEIRLVRSEPLRIGGQQGHEIIAEAKEVKSNADVMITQWLRFAGSGHLRVLGMARKEGWGETFMRLRQVRDGITLN